MESLLYLFLTITFILHGAAFTVMGARRRKGRYLILTGTFAFLTTMYLMKFHGWDWRIPGVDFPLHWLLRVGATLCTLIYLGASYREKDSWVRRAMHRRR